MEGRNQEPAALPCVFGSGMFLNKFSEGMSLSFGDYSLQCYTL